MKAYNSAPTSRQASKENFSASTSSTAESDRERDLDHGYRVLLRGILSIERDGGDWVGLSIARSRLTVLIERNDPAFVTEIIARTAEKISGVMQAACPGCVAKRVTLNACKI